MVIEIRTADKYLPGESVFRITKWVNWPRHSEKD